MQIIINTPKTENVQEIKCGEHIERFLLNQSADPSKHKKGLSRKGVATLRDETIDILSRCNPHDAVDKEETTHLVVGYVQSGKTMSFTALTALALDNSYRMIIYLAGTKNNLLDQTYKRLKKDLIGTDFTQMRNYRLHQSSDDIEDIVGHLETSTRPIILMPILKNYIHINNLAKQLDNTEFKQAMQGETVLIIDDEADQASLNSYGRKNSKDNTELTSSTYAAILKLRSVLPGHSYIQYTATPQANILISMQDLLSPKHHTVLTPGEGYIGGKLFFGKGEDNDLYEGKLIEDIPDNEVFHKTKNLLKSIPNSLKDALKLHILAVCLVVKHDEKVPFLSMMIHPDNTKKYNKRFHKWVEEELQNWRKFIKQPDTDFDKKQLLLSFERLYPEAVKFYENPPKFSEIKGYIKDVLNDKKVWLVNTDKDAETEIRWEEYSMHVLVGAEMLNRGFTIENLATTYMPRYSTGLSTADTIQQRCRFFGYKSSYIQSCRVFIPRWTKQDYIDYVEHEEEMRATLKDCHTLNDAEHKVMLSPRLRPTRQNVLPISVVNVVLSGMKALQSFETKQIIEKNKALSEEFINKHKDEFDETTFRYNTVDRSHRIMKVDVEEAIEFLSNFSFVGYNDVMQKSNTVRYLRYLAEKETNPIKYVYFVQMAFRGEARHRSFDKETGRLAANTALFAGPSSAQDSTNYPGDAKIVGGNDSITIQLHHLWLDGAPIKLPNEAYTLAIFYPQELATSYCSNKDIPMYYEGDGEDEDNEGEGD